IHQPRYSMLDRRPEDGLLTALDELGVGSIAYSPLEQGILTDRYLNGIPAGSRAAGDSPFLTADAVTPALLERLRALDALAKERGQSLAQRARAWVLRGGRLTSAVVGASSVGQLENSVEAVRNLEFGGEELARIEELLAGPASA
nr:aldo/keto reductase [Streptomyces sp. DSM 41633]